MEGWVSSQEGMEYRAQRVDIFSGGMGRNSPKSFWSYVAGGAKYLPGLGQRSGFRRILLDTSESKSVTTGRPCRTMMTLEGFRSRCAIPRSWAQAIASQMSINQRTAWANGGRSLFRRPERSSPSHKVHGEVGLPLVLTHLMDLDDRRMLQRCGGSGFHLKSSTSLL